jgi:hypothetical protein
MKMEQIECSETSALKIQTPGNHPEENIQGINVVIRRLYNFRIIFVVAILMSSSYYFLKITITFETCSCTQYSHIDWYIIKVVKTANSNIYFSRTVSGNWTMLCLRESNEWSLRASAFCCQGYE